MLAIGLFLLKFRNSFAEVRAQFCPIFSAPNITPSPRSI